MSVVLVGARHYGEQLRRARQMLNINRRTAAKLLRINATELRNYELGRMPIPPDLICTLLQRGLALTMCRTYNVANAMRK